MFGNDIFSYCGCVWYELSQIDVLSTETDTSDKWTFKKNYLTIELQDRTVSFPFWENFNR